MKKPSMGQSEAKHQSPGQLELVEPSLAVGSHDELLAKKGQYAQLFGIQAAAYR
jgi:hypothetical protein